MFYRTYIIKFKKTDGCVVYCGKRLSKYRNPNDDKYTGSGLVIKRAIKKYGKGCIISIEWFTHETENEMDEHEKFLIKEHKDKFGDICVNIHEGGNGGNTIKFMDDASRESFKRKISETKLKNSSEISKMQKSYWNSPEGKEKRSSCMKKMWEEMSDNERLKRSNSQKESQNRPEVNKKRSESLKVAFSSKESRKVLSESIKKSKRTGFIWDMYNDGRLFKLWEKSGFVPYRRFRTWIVNNTKILIDNPYLLNKPVKQMMKDMGKYYVHE